jgi:hypothetical protein
MTRRLPSMVLRFAMIGLVLLSISAGVARAQVVVKVNDVVNFRLGFQIQPWLDWTQDPISEGYQQSMFIRRVRLILAGNVAKDVSFFFQTDNPRLGNTIGSATGAKNLNTGFLVQDAFGEWRVFGNDALILGVGKMIVGETRNTLQSTSSHLSWDGGTFDFLQGAGTGSDASRDVGVQFKGYLAADHFEYRMGIWDGQRAPSNAAGAGSRNSYRYSGRVQYNFMDTERGYTYVGTNLGKKKILSIGGGFDTQSKYNSYGADFMADIPMGAADPKGANSFTLHGDYIHFDGGCDLNSTGTARLTNCLIPTLAPQDEFFTDAGFFFKDINLQPFVRFEYNGFKDNIDKTKNQRRYGGGFNYYVSPAAQNLKITTAVERIVPNRPGAATWKTKDTWHYLVQFQFYYF